MTWTELLAFAGAAGLLSAVLNQTFTVVSSFWSRRRRAAHLALRLAVLLETYGKTCSDTASDTATHISSGGHAGNAAHFVPEVPEVPASSEAWEHLSAALAHRVLAFPYRISDLNSAIRQADDIIGDEERRTMLWTMEVGVEAYILGKDLRFAYDLPQFEEASGTITWLQQTAGQVREKIKEIEQRQAESHRKMMATMPTTPPTPS